MKNIILASSSPRRKELLSELIRDFSIRKPVCEEIELENPKDSAKENARIKANSIEKEENDIVIGCDTVVALENKHFGKPYTKQKAIEMINELKNKWHFVYTGVCVRAKKDYYFVEESRVFIKDMTENEIVDYVNNFKPFDKAGAYGIQDSIVVKEYCGEYQNIIGLPFKRLKMILLENNIDVKENSY